MPHNQLLEELKELGDEIIAADKADRKTRKAARHPEYRKKRISEGADLWDKYNKKLKEIKKVIHADDPCLKDVTDVYQQVYEEYTESIMSHLI